MPEGWRSMERNIHIPGPDLIQGLEKEGMFILDLTVRGGMGGKET